jgi:hypothetical protein
MSTKIVFVFQVLLLQSLSVFAVNDEIRNVATESQPTIVSLADEIITLSFSHERGYYNEPFLLIISADANNPDIYYTTDCSTPSPTNGTRYQEGIPVDSTTILKVIAVTANGMSVVYTQSYLFVRNFARQGAKPQGFPLIWGGSSSIPADYAIDSKIVQHPDYAGDINDAFISIPSLSLSMNVDEWFNHMTGVYVGYPNSNISREKAVHAEFIFPGTSESFSVACGVQNQGGTSIENWKVPKQSMRLLFKEPYGPTRLHYKLFPDSEINSINTLVVDAFLYGWTHPFDNKQRVTSLFFRDQLCSDLQNKMGWNSFHGIYVHLFINGLYWGLYDLHERPDDAFMAWYLKGSREDFDIIKHNPNTVVSGTNTSYNYMLYVARMGFKTYERFNNFKKYLDIPAFIDYMLLNFYLGNFDWAEKNYYASVNRSEISGFRFYTWDAEHVMRYSDVNYDNTLKNDKGGPTEIHTLLKENEEYRMMFADAVYKHCFNKGALTPESFLESFMFRKNEIDKAVILESARWGDYLKATTGTTYTRNDHWLPETEKVINEYIPKRCNVFLTQLRSSSNRLFPSVMPPLIETQKAELSERINITLSNQNTADGDIWFTTDGSDPRLPGGSVKGQKYSGTISIEKNIHLKARFRSKYSGEWSALAEEIFIIDPGLTEKLVITEIMYNPKKGYPEFIELTNTGEEAIALKGFSFTDGITYTFSRNDVVNSGKGIVLTNDTILFLKNYRVPAYGQYNKKLSNEGETIILRNNLNLLIDSATYSGSSPWPVIPGGGYSIVLKDHSMDNSLPESWIVSETVHGTPYKNGIPLPWEAMLFPNPARDYVTIHPGKPELAFSKFRIEVFNQNGLRLQSLATESINSRITIDLTNMQEGFYYLRLIPHNSNFEVLGLKLIKIK